PGRIPQAVFDESAYLLDENRRSRGPDDLLRALQQRAQPTPPLRGVAPQQPQLARRWRLAAAFARKRGHRKLAQAWPRQALADIRHQAHAQAALDQQRNGHDGVEFQPLAWTDTLRLQIALRQLPACQLTVVTQQGCAAQ